MKSVAVLTSGGDAPGMNATIRSVVRTAIYHDIKVYGISHGYDGLIKGEIKLLTKADVGNIIHRGGTILRTSRSAEFKTVEGRKKAYDQLRKRDISGLVCIGGNGTYTGALIFGEEYKDVRVIGLPGTIDNDIYGTDFTIGFDTAVNTAIEAIDKIRDTADSHNRLFFIEVMGRHAGFIGLNAGIGSGAGDLFLPETTHGIEHLIQRLKTANRRKKLFNLIIVAEGHEGGGAMALAQKATEQLTDYDVKVTILGHLQRGGSPTGADRVLASRLGYAAIEALRSGHTGIAIGQKDNLISHSTLNEAISLKSTPDKDLIQMAQILAL